MMPPLTMFQQLLMQGRGTAPQQGQPQAPQPAPQPQPAAAKPSRLDGLLRRYDQFATGSADSSTLNPQQRSLMRRQLAMNIGGAIQQGQPIAAGVSAHGANLAAQQEQMLKQQAAQAEMARQQGVQGIFAQQNGGGQMPMGGQGGEPMSPAQQRMAEREAATQQYRALLAAGYFEEADQFSEQMQRVYPELNLEQVNTGQTIEMVDQRTGDAVQSYETSPTDYQSALLGNANARLALAQQAGARADAAAGGGEGPPVIMEVGGERFYRRGNSWERIPAGAGGGAAGGAGAAGGGGPLNDRQQSGVAIMRDNTLEYVASMTGVPKDELAEMTPKEVENVLLEKGRRTLQGPVLGRIPFLSSAANADLAPFATGAASGQALFNNPTGIITTPDQEVAQRQQPGAHMPLPTQGAIVRRNLEMGRPVGNTPAPPRTVTRTGKTKDGRRVVEYSDGTREVQ